MNAWLFGSLFGGSLHKGKAVHRSLEVEGLILVGPDKFLEDVNELTGFLQEAFHLPLEAIDDLDEMRERAPATAVAVLTEDGFRTEVEYATLWESGVTYSAPDDWPETISWSSVLPMPEGCNLRAAL